MAFTTVDTLLFRLPTAESYVRHSHGQDFAPGYLVIDYVNKGQMLSQVWDAIDGDDDKRKTLYRDLSRVKLSLAATPFPRIGSLSMDNHAVVSLSNRPLLLEMHRAENDEIPTNIPRDRTYATSDAFVMDQLACMDNHVRHQPNAVVDEEDGEGQMAALTMMRGILPHYVDQTHRFGPFVLSFTDLHTSNVFVDTESGHITSLIDLEWAFAGPVDMVMMAPFWLTQKAIDELTDDNLVAYDQRRQEFVHAFRTEEAALRCGGKTVWTEQMQQGWDNQSFWYYMALQSPTGLYNLFLDHLCPPYGMLPEHWTVFDAAVSRYWTRGAAQFIHDKLQEREHYQENLRAFFQQETERLESDVDGDGKQATEGAPKELSL